MKRRNFVQSVLIAGIGVNILPACSLSGRSATDKLNIALIGAYGRGQSFWEILKTENVVALCDVNSDNMALATKEFPNANQYTDWRKCLDQKDIEAVIIATPDHHHAFIAIAAMNRGMHVYCEKPLGESVHEAREVRKVYLENKNKLATQHGTQRHAIENFDRVEELIRGGAIGELKQVQAFGSRTHNRTGYLSDKGPAPASIDWEQWIGPVQMHPFNPGYFLGKPGLNCLQWNMYHDFGSWQVGDMGSHTMDLAWNAIDAGIPTSIEATGDPYHNEVCPSDLHAVFQMPANKWRDEIQLEWFQGNLKPESPHNAVDISKIGHGVLFRGTKGSLLADFSSRMLIPEVKGADMTYYNPPSKKEVAPAHGNFTAQWLTACKSDLKTSCDFDYAGNMIETLMLGLAAHRANKKLEYDSKTGTVTNDSAANEYLKKEYRPGWSLHG
ncbi:MAG: Gfo/Idh/MocA family protein [Bacteroidota bacterium]